MLGQGNSIVKAAAAATLSLGAVLFFSGCGKDSSTAAKAAPELNLARYIEESCAFDANAGEPVKPVKTADPLADTYFGKRYNRDWFRSVLRSSMRATAEYIETTGTEVYQAPGMSPKTCKNLSFLKTMSAEIAQEWQNTARNVAAENPGAFLSGLYLFKEYFSSGPTIPDVGVIVVREDSNRWTLLHEFLHHNFKVQAAAQGYRDSQVQERRRSLIFEIERIKADPSLSDADRARRWTPLFIEYYQVSDLLFVQYYLEEIAVDALLQDAYDDGALTYVPAGAYENASAYTEASREKVKGAFAALEFERDRLLALVDAHGLKAEKERLGALDRIKKGRLAQFDYLIAKRADSVAKRDSIRIVESEKSHRTNKRKKRNTSQGFVLGEMHGAKPNSRPPCGDAIAADRQIDRMIRETRSLMSL
jgi:hypothetical protein